MSHVGRGSRRVVLYRTPTGDHFNIAQFLQCSYNNTIMGSECVVRYRSILKSAGVFQRYSVTANLEVHVHHGPAFMPTSHIQRSPAEVVDRPNVAEFQIRQGVERIFCLKLYPDHILDGARAVQLRKLVIRNRPAPVSKLTGVVR